MALLLPRWKAKTRTPALLNTDVRIIRNFWQTKKAKQEENQCNLMSQVLPSHPENDAMPIYVANTVYKQQGCCKMWLMILLGWLSWQTQVWSHFQVLDNRNIKDIMYVICPGRSEMGKSFNRQRQISPITTRITRSPFCDGKGACISG